MAAAEPLAPNQPHIGIVLLWYPLFTQPFIFREVEALSRIMPIKIYTLYGSNSRCLSEEMKQTSVELHTYGTRALPGICGEMLAQMISHPLRFWQLGKRSLGYKWPTLEVFGENLWAFAAGFSLARRFQEDGIDFVYAPWPRGAATAAWVGATLAGIPFGIAARGDNLSPADPDLAAKFSAARLIRANNKADQNRIELFGSGEGSGKSTLVYNSLSLPPPKAVNTDRFKGDAVKLLALGRFDVTKGFDILLKACAVLKQRHIPFTLTLAGGGGKVMGLGSQTQKILDLRQSLDLENEVQLPGLVSHDELPALLESHDIFLAPCVIHESGRRDGIPNTVIEALTYAMPVITTDVNALPEVVRHRDTGLLVPPGNPEALADAICYLFEHPEEALAMGNNGAKLAKELFDPASNAQRLQRMFLKVCEGQSCVE